MRSSPETQIQNKDMRSIRGIELVGKCGSGEEYVCMFTPYVCTLCTGSSK